MIIFDDLFCVFFMWSKKNHINKLVFLILQRRFRFDYLYKKKSEGTKN